MRDLLKDLKDQLKKRRISMRVFLLRFDSNIFQSVVPDDLKIWETDVLAFDGTAKSDSWNPPAFRVYNPKLREADFFGIGPGTIGLRTPLVEKIRTILERAGQILPITIDGEAASCLNVTECVNCLDHKKTEWVLGRETKQPIRISRYVFRPDMMPESSLFKIPETAKSNLLVHSGLVESESGLFEQVEMLRLTGVKFELLFDDANDSAKEDGGHPEQRSGRF